MGELHWEGEVNRWCEYVLQCLKDLKTRYKKMQYKSVLCLFVNERHFAKVQQYDIIKTSIILNS